MKNQQEIHLLADFMVNEAKQFIHADDVRSISIYLKLDVLTDRPVILGRNICFLRAKMSIIYFLRCFVSISSAEPKMSLRPEI